MMPSLNISEPPATPEPYPTPDPQPQPIPEPVPEPTPEPIPNQNRISKDLYFLFDDLTVLNFIIFA